MNDASLSLLDMTIVFFSSVVFVFDFFCVVSVCVRPCVCSCRKLCPSHILMKALDQSGARSMVFWQQHQHVPCTPQCNKLLG